MALRRRAFTPGAIASAGLTVTGLAVSPRVASAATHTAYLKTHFTESPNQSAANYGLHLAVSRDGLNWSPKEPRHREHPRRSIKHRRAEQLHHLFRVTS
ncbi:hypothetical protein AB0875_21915 [Micromonospora gifhornensis]|uniref:hypothetical protein n=1 Tax=Micromonospora gifhornensis TaxID=84594 RepID=UPI003451867B